MIRGQAKLQSDIRMWMARVEEAPVKVYRDVVWAIFVRILEQTPQASGLAVANWKIGINAPDLSFDGNEGEDAELTKSGYIKRGTLRARGDPKWINQAIDHNKFLIRQIKRGDKVWISNSTVGANGEPYLTEYQNASWAAKLRAVNRPYESAQESATLIAEELLATGNMPIGNAGFGEDAE